MARHAARPSNKKSLAIGSNRTEKLRSRACSIAIADLSRRRPADHTFSFIVVPVEPTA